MDWGGVCSDMDDMDAKLICCGEERVEHKCQPLTGILPQCLLGEVF